MNIYKVLVLNAGVTAVYYVAGFDLVSAIQGHNTYINPAYIINAQLVDSTEVKQMMG